MTGGRINLRVKVTNRGGAGAGPSKLLGHLAPENATALADSVGRAKVRRIAARHSAKARIKVRIPLDIPAGRWRLVVCVGSGKGANDCLTGKTLEVRDGSSWGRIEAARASGKLSQAKALLYELYAMRGDKRLPRAYTGPGELPSGTVFANLAAAFPSLSAADQALLAPYMIEPRYRQSAWGPSKHSRLAPRATASADTVCDDLDSLSGAWKGIKTAHAWFWTRPGNPAASARAGALAGEFERTIWPKLTAAFKTVDDSNSDLCDPLGDSRIDIYLSPPGNSVLGNNRGVTPGLILSPGCKSRTSFIIVKENANRSVLAHEFMHVIQWAYPVCDRAPSWVEGTAAWAEDFVYHADQVEHEYKTALSTPFISMLSQGRTDGYQAWPFWFSLYKKEGIAGIQRVFNSLAGRADFPAALESGPSDGLREAWKRYAIERWNQEPVGASGFPVRASFRNSSWDSFSVLPVTAKTVDVIAGASGVKSFILDSSTQAPLTTWFNPVKIKDPKVRQVVFQNAEEGRPGSVVQAMIKLASGKSRLEDWSNKPKVSLCRDKSDENVVELIIATSNASPRGEPLGEAKHIVTGKNSCSLPTRYQGTWTRVYTWPDRGTWKETIEGTATFVRNPLFPPEVDGQTSVPYEVTSSSVTWTVSGSTPGSCGFVFSGQGTDTPTSNSSFGIPTVMSLESVSGRTGAVDPEPKPYYYSLRASIDPGLVPQYDVTDTCAGTTVKEGLVLPYLDIGWPSPFDTDTPLDRLLKSADPALLDGHLLSDNGSGIMIEDTWSFSGSD